MCLRAPSPASPRVHLLGLTSDGGVHSEFEHMRALIELAADLRTEDLVLHCITDGRDTSPTEGMHYLETVERWCMQARRRARGERRGALLRDGSRPALGAHPGPPTTCWCTADAEHHTGHAGSAAREAYGAVRPTSSSPPRWSGQEGMIRPGDSVLCLNFRPDRMRQLVRALADPSFGEAGEDLPGWRGRGGARPVRALATMSEYQEDWPYPVRFPRGAARRHAGAVISRAGETQLHVAETEKYPHVTYFFNGGVEQPLAGERRELVPSQRDVPTYDQKPADERARDHRRVPGRLRRRSYPRFSVVNFANADMVGHTGVIAATITRRGDHGRVSG